MAKEYIKRETLISRINGMGYHEQIKNNLLFIARMIPAADVAEVRHGRWEKHGSKWQCTGCKVLMSIDGTPQENLLYYCPNCGAYMMGENNGKCE